MSTESASRGKSAAALRPARICSGLAENPERKFYLFSGMPWTFRRML